MQPGQSLARRMRSGLKALAILGFTLASGRLAASALRAPQPELADASSVAISLDSFLAGEFGGDWAQARRRLLALGVFDEEALATRHLLEQLPARPVVDGSFVEHFLPGGHDSRDPGTLLGHFRARMADLPRPKELSEDMIGFSVAEVTSDAVESLVDYAHPSWNPDNKAFGAHEQLLLGSLEEATLAELAERAERATDLLRVALEQACERDEFLRFPSKLALRGQAPDLEHFAALHPRPSPIQGTVIAGAWTILVEMSPGLSPEFDAAVQQIRAVKQAWIRGVHDLIESF